MGSTRLRRSHYVHFETKWYVPQQGAVTYLLSFSETASFSETLFKMVGKPLSEIVDFDESFTRQVGKNVSETADYGEAISRKVNKSFGELIDITEDFNSNNTFLVAFAETLSFVEAFLATFIPNPGVQIFGRSRRRRRGSQPGGHNV